MSVELAITVLTCQVGAGVAVLLGAIPWAYSLHGRLTKIEAALKDYLRSVDRLAVLERRLAKLNQRRRRRRR